MKRSMRVKGAGEPDRSREALYLHCAAFETAVIESNRFSPSVKKLLRRNVRIGSVLEQMFYSPPL